MKEVRIIFPQISYDVEQQLTTEETGERSLLFDYKTNSFVVKNGNVQETSRVEAVKQWIELFIRVELGKYAIYSDNFGLDLSNLIGYRLPRSVQVSEIIRRLHDGIINGCKHVTDVQDFSFDKGTFSFTVITDLGEEVLKFEY
nr:MAG TPA: Protein of unknown function (DUF2634) [Caudoviricetes sp.]